MRINAMHKNAVLGTLIEVSSEWDPSHPRFVQVVIRDDDPFEPTIVPLMVRNGDDALLLIDRKVIVHEGFIYGIH